jgi:hypothetical protein
MGNGIRVRAVAALALLAAVALALAAAAAAATVVVTQNSNSWAPMSATAGGAYRFTEEYDAPPGLGEGSLELTTNLTTTAKSDYWTFAHAGTPLADVDTLSYWTFQSEDVQPPHAAVSYQVQIDANGLAAEGGFTTLVYEPYQNGAVVKGVWQQWDVDNGQFWSSRTFVSGTCVLAAGAGGAPFYNLALLKTLCPDAVVLGIGVNIGSNNPGYTVATDGVTFNDTTYDFELGRRPSSKDECKNGGWQDFDDPAFKNQGDCVSFVNAQSS